MSYSQCHPEALEGFLIGLREPQPDRMYDFNL
jgi:hypothetical protein